MQKIVLKTALTTVVAVIIALILAFGIASLGFPQSMASMCAKYGNYRFATSYASLRYAYTKSVDDLDVCAKYSILSKHDGNIVKFCGQLVENEGFDTLGAKIIVVEVNDVEHEVAYKQYICGNLSAAQYRRGDTQKAVATAENAMEDETEFTFGNAFVTLSTEVYKKTDKATAQQILDIITAKNYAATETYTAVINVLQELTA